ncbi:MAG TPA: hypothetical protein V6D19_15070 [Stenomitos sp.]
MLKQLVAASIIASTVAASGMALAGSAPQPKSKGPGHKPQISYPESRTVNTQTKFAVVNDNGITARGRGVVSSQSLGTGLYEVIFNRDVTTCSYVATVGSSATSGTSPSGEMTVVGRFGNANGVFLTSKDSAGNAVNRGFHLQVLCP